MIVNTTLHGFRDLTAKAASRQGTEWLTLTFITDDGKFELVVFMDFDQAEVIADAIARIRKPESVHP